MFTIGLDPEGESVAEIQGPRPGESFWNRVQVSGDSEVNVLRGPRPRQTQFEHDATLGDDPVPEHGEDPRQESFEHDHLAKATHRDPGDLGLGT